ncbi:fumarylacetoacetate hydrolase [Bradyrhizobium sp. WSM 1704]|uniref:fumarylacetoacetate hydrolase family protein n=1 Tax=Bradyrhizobium semiaridum TaxID=2821404 RepID=UPI001CE2EEA3|nr:fumarylacetoacetate hydrolase [Bradyrhizobium semiaridum]MCA6121104.1 fumarylacetoacetate hydrolase [Bradyrhizobium semiaridum]
MISLTPQDVLPEDGTSGTLVGRVWLPQAGGPAVAAIRADGVFDVTAAFPTVSALCAEADPAAALGATKGERIGDLAAILANTPPDRRDSAKPHLLAPVDLQVLKAAGVTFAISMLERVIEERARGNPSSAEAIRKEVVRLVGDDLSKLKPGSEQAMKLKQVLIDQNAWSQYLEVGIGPDAEVFIRLFDATFSLDDVRKMDVGLTVKGTDGFVLEGHSSISKISRDPTDLVAQTIGPVHQYPDGFALFLGTMFAPVKDRDAKGEGFTHKRDDIVTIAAPQLGKLVNRMRTSDECEPWTFGVGALMKNLAQRKLL